jgi:hypothetical protein
MKATTHKNCSMADKISLRQDEGADGKNGLEPDMPMF